MNTIAQYSIAPISPQAVFQSKPSQCALDLYPSSIYANGRERRVKNLGWLLRHWKDVSHFTIRTTIESQKLKGTLLIAWCKNGVHYSSGWAGDIDHVHQWLDRPVFRGIAGTIDPPSDINASKHPGERHDFIV